MAAQRTEASGLDEPAFVTLNRFVAKRLALSDELAALLERALQLGKFFPNFTKKDLEGMLNDSALYQYPKDAEVVSQGKEGRDLFIIYSGSVSAYRQENGARRLVAIFKPGEFFGEIGLVRDDAIRTATVITSEESSIFRLTWTDIFYHLDRTPALGEHLRAIANLRVKFDS